MGIRQVLLVAQREIRQRLRSKAFVGTTALLGVVVLAAAVVFSSGLLGGDEVPVPRLVLVDDAQELGEGELAGWIGHGGAISSSDNEKY